MNDAAAPRWVVVAPLDSSGENRGEANAPAALRAAGVVERIGALDGSDTAWLHVDLDVLSTDALVAVSYRQPGGLSWEELESLLGPLVASPRLAGLSVADLNADLDRDGAGARRACDLIFGLLKEGHDGEPV